MTTSDRDPHGGGEAAPEPGDMPGALREHVPAYEPPAELEERVVRSLATRGLLAPAGAPGAGWRVWKGFGLLAAAVALFIAGAAAERARASTAGEAGPDASPRFALLLYGGPATTSPDEEAALVIEYGRWARALAGEGRIVTGEKLGDAAVDLDPSSPAPGTPPYPPRAWPPPEALRLGGFFIIGASSLAEAEEIARTMPHLRRGGRVVVRPIDPT